MSLIKSLSRIQTFLSQNAPSQLAEWGEGLREDQINDLVKDIPCVLSYEVRELYKWHNGSGYNSIPHDYYYFSSLEDTVGKYKIFNTFPDSWEPSFLPLFICDSIEFLFVDCNKNDSPVWYRFLEDGSQEILWSSITKMMQTVAEAYETRAYYFDNGNFITDHKKLLEVMWKNDPDIIEFLIQQLRIVKEQRLVHIPCGYASIQRFAWDDISELLTRDRAKVDMLQEFTSIFLDECDRIINSPKV